MQVGDGADLGHVGGVTLGEPAEEAGQGLFRGAAGAANLDRFQADAAAAPQAPAVEC